MLVTGHCALLQVKHLLNLSGNPLRKEHRLSVFESRVMRIFGPKREEMVGGWRRLHKEELYNLYASPNTVMMIKSRMRLVGHVACIG
jgi:hypothetical protein